MKRARRRCLASRGYAPKIDAPLSLTITIGITHFEFTYRNYPETARTSQFYLWHEVLEQPRGFVMRHVYYGPEYSDAEIARELTAGSLDFEPSLAAFSAAFAV